MANDDKAYHCWVCMYSLAVIHPGTLKVIGCHSDTPLQY